MSRYSSVRSVKVTGLSGQYLLLQNTRFCRFENIIEARYFMLVGSGAKSCCQKQEC